MAKSPRNGGTAVAERPRTELKAATVRVQYPQDNETISHPSYSIHIAADEPAAAVEVCIDQGDWRPAREAIGLWWFDWSGYESGEHEVVARLKKPDGTVLTSDPRVFNVKIA